jgi:hypothetical protein
MKTTTVSLLAKLFCLIGLAGLISVETKAETVYKCLTGGKINFTSAPKDGQNCHPVELRVLQPNPEEVARELEKKRIRDEEDKREEEQMLVEKKQRDTETALRKAKSAEEALRVLKDSTPTIGSGRSRTWMGVFPKPGQGTEGRITLPAPSQERPEIMKISPGKTE